MNNIPKLIAYGIGSLGLVVTTFVAFSIFTGTPMHEMKAVGAMFPENIEAEITEGEDPDLLPEAEVERDADVRSPRQIYESSATALGAFTLTDPFSAEELRDLEQTLQTQIGEVGRRARELAARERQLEDDRQHLADLYREFEKLKTGLLEQSADNQSAEGEIARDRRILDERRQQTYAQMASLFEDTKASEAARLLTSVYGPQEAAQILVQLDDDRVRELIGAISNVMPEEAPTYVRELQALRGALGDG